MRRKDREMSVEFALKLIDRLPYGTLSIIDTQGYPYGLPLSIVRKDKTFYFHSAKQGKKVEALHTNPIACLSFVGKTNIPELYTKEQLQEFLKDEKKGATLISKVFTTEFESAIVFGKVELVEDKTEAIEAMRLICKKYTPTKMHLFDLAINSGLNRTYVYKLKAKSITAKRKQFDSMGEEMKWQREE